MYVQVDLPAGLFVHGGPPQQYYHQPSPQPQPVYYQPPVQQPQQTYYVQQQPPQQPYYREQQQQSGYSGADVALAVVGGMAMGAIGEELFDEFS